MLQALVNFSLKFRGVVVVLACVVIGYGLYVGSQAKLDVFPNFVQPQVVVQTECPGLAPEQVELLVTKPIETTINGLGDMESLRSESIGGLSIITAVFKEGTDVFRARQMLAEQLAELAGELPATVKTPRMTPLTSSTMDLLKIGLVAIEPGEDGGAGFDGGDGRGVRRDAQSAGHDSDGGAVARARGAGRGGRGASERRERAVARRVARGRWRGNEIRRLRDSRALGRVDDDVQP